VVYLLDPVYRQLFDGYEEAACVFYRQEDSEILAVQGSTF
jgi:hypothetical protein